MKNKISFNFLFALLAFPIGLALFREFNFETLAFKKTALGLLYLVVFIGLIYLTFKRKTKPADK